MNRFKTERLNRVIAILLFSCWLCPASNLRAQPAKAMDIVISELPKSTNPATALPEKLGVLATVEFDDRPLTDLAAWINQQTGILVTIDRQSFRGTHILPSEPVTDKLNNEPIHLLLDRLRYKGIDWRLQDNGINLYADDDKNQLVTANYNVGDLFDKQFDADELKETIVESIGSSTWREQGGNAEITVLGDVLFVRQTFSNHRMLVGLLSAIRSHGRRTLVNDAPQNDSIRQKLQANISFEFSEKPLEFAIEDLKQQVGVDIRLDTRSLNAVRFHQRTPTSIQIVDQKLSSALDALVALHDLDWSIGDGVLWITTTEGARISQKVAVFDVRDLCRNEDESVALAEAIEAQSNWNSIASGHEIAFPVHGTMVLKHSERVLDEVLTLIENYRLALRGSKQRNKPGSDPTEIVSRFYRLPTDVATELETQLPTLISKSSWKVNNTQAKGSIRRLKSWRRDAHDGSSSSNAPPESYSVLVIEQTREVQNLLPELFHRIQFGDSVQSTKSGRGGFGGGFFRVSTSSLNDASSMSGLDK